MIMRKRWAERYVEEAVSFACGDREVDLNDEGHAEHSVAGNPRLLYTQINASLRILMQQQSRSTVKQKIFLF
jgi:hypothetical protein